ncbi:MAG: TetR/AcrR family transcriptional regulator [Planctomycetota bacterium]
MSQLIKVKGLRHKATARRGRPADPGLCARRRDQILKAAARVFARKGFDASDVNDIAREAGIGKGTIYYHVHSKKNLFLASVDWLMQELIASIGAATNGVADPLAVIESAIRAYLEFFDAHPEFAELIIQERAVFRDRQTPTYFRYSESEKGPWRSMYLDLMRQGRIRKMPVERILDTVGSVLYGAIFTNHFAGRRKSLAQQAKDILDICFLGMLSDSERARKGPRNGKGSR